MRSLLLALLLWPAAGHRTTTTGVDQNVTECIDASGRPTRVLHEGDHFAVLGSGFGSASGSVVLGWYPDAVLTWGDTRVDAVAGAVAPGMHSGLAPVVVHHADGSLSVSTFKVEIVSNTIP